MERLQQQVLDATEIIIKNVIMRMRTDNSTLLNPIAMPLAFDKRRYFEIE